MESVIISKDEKKNGIEKQISDIQDRIKSKLNELKNLYREYQCCMEFIKVKKLDEDYDKFRNEFYHNRKWR